MNLAATVSPDAALGAAVVLFLAVTGAFWKLATMLAEIRGEVRHNGGGSLKDRITTIGAAVDEIRASLSGHSESLKGLDTRITDHRRRNDAAVAALREHLDRKLAGMEEGRVVSDAARSILHELGMTPPDER